MSRPSRHRGRQVRRRGLSLKRICVMTGVNDLNDLLYLLYLERFEIVDELRPSIKRYLRRFTRMSPGGLRAYLD